jgi:phospholipid-binding lipoprotein MlaA
MMKNRSKTLRLIFMSLLLICLLYASGCSTTPKQTADLEPPLHVSSEILKETVVYSVDVYDPIEGFNRRVYAFNYYFDKFIYLPIVNTYEFITPNYVEDRVSNFVDNVFEFSNFFNNLLQFEFEDTGITLVRFVINTTIGVGGLWDRATECGLERQTEDFGLTLAHHGVGNGPYLVLPVFGPSNLRDTTGLVVDAVTFSQAGPPAWVDDEDATLIFNVVTAIDKRHRQSFRYYQNGTPFEYDSIRMLYTAKRKIEASK